MYDRVSVPRLITDFREAAPETVAYVREDTTEDDPTGLFCRCGSDGVTQPDTRPRDDKTISEHARNLAATLAALTELDPDADDLASEALRLHGENDKCGVELFEEAVNCACRD